MTDYWPVPYRLDPLVDSSHKGWTWPRNPYGKRRRCHGSPQATPRRLELATSRWDRCGDLDEDMLWVMTRLAEKAAAF